MKHIFETAKKHEVVCYNKFKIGSETVKNDAAVCFARWSMQYNECNISSNTLINYAVVWSVRCVHIVQVMEKNYSQCLQKCDRCGKMTQKFVLQDSLCSTMNETYIWDS